jgi:N-hydroxyarylamine O-acetyltransferase
MANSSHFSQETAELPQSLLEIYLQRLGLSSLPDRNLKGLTTLHRAHANALVFENLSPFLNDGVDVDVAKIAEKMLKSRRGGYCFEHNSLFAHVLAQAGFSVRFGEARVVMGRSDLPPRTHLVLKVELDGTTYLVDVGFGGPGLVEPMPLVKGTANQSGWRFRTQPRGGDIVLQCEHRDSNASLLRDPSNFEVEWFDLYWITPNDVQPIDIEVANWYVSTHPKSIFRRMVTAQRSIGAVRHVLRDLDYCVSASPQESQTQKVSPDEAIALMHTVFELDVPKPELICDYLHRLGSAQ